MAGFQLSINGRFWVSTEGISEVSGASERSDTCFRALPGKWLRTIATHRLALNSIVAFPDFATPGW
jgi:hypothetical protein